MKPTEKQIKQIFDNYIGIGLDDNKTTIIRIIEEWERLKEKESCRENIKDIIEEVADYLRGIDLEYFTTDEIAADIVSIVLRL